MRQTTRATKATTLNTPYRILTRMAALLAVLVIMNLSLASANAALSNGDTLQLWDDDAAGGAANPRYEEGQTALRDKQWRQAVIIFSELIDEEYKADACIYWKAHSQHKLGRSSDALDSIASLKSRFPGSSWVKSAKALEMEIRGPSAEEARDIADDELKIIALHSLMERDPERAMPILVRFLESDRSDELKEQALFILSQSGTAEAMEIMLRYAESQDSPELQMQAVHMLGLEGGEESLRALRRIYERAANNDVKTTVLHSLMLADDRDLLLEVARSENDPELRMVAVHQLGLMEAVEEMRELYERESSTEVKAAILHAMFLADDADRLADIARDETNEELRLVAIHNIGLTDNISLLKELWQTETSQAVRESILHSLFLSDATDELFDILQQESDPELRAVAVHNLGLIGGSRVRELLSGMYRDETDTQVKEAIMHGLFIDEDAGALIAIASSETNQELRSMAVHWLGLIDSDEATEYLIKLLE